MHSWYFREKSVNLLLILRALLLLWQLPCPSVSNALVKIYLDISSSSANLSQHFHLANSWPPETSRIGDGVYCIQKRKESAVSQYKSLTQIGHSGTPRYQLKELSYCLIYNYSSMYKLNSSYCNRKKEMVDYVGRNFLIFRKRALLFSKLFL